MKMITFDSFTLVPSYSDITSRSEVDTSISICGAKSELPIINANMLAICTPEMVDVLSNKHSTFSSYHRFFESESTKINAIKTILNVPDPQRKQLIQKFWMSIGTKQSEYTFIDSLYKLGIKNVIVDVNHGHHLAVKEMTQWIKETYPDMLVMAGNVSSTDGIKFLKDSGADIIKIGNSFGSTCSTRLATSFGVTSIHCAKTYREDTNDWDVNLCADGGIRSPADIVKALIWSDLVMIGGMFGGCDESFGTKIVSNGVCYKETYGNASIKTKQVADETNHVKFIEGETKLVNSTGPLSLSLKGIKEGLQSAFSFIGARNLKEFQSKVQNQILML
ncbi:MAG: IMP dehydrogenase [Bacteroidia bacterium]